MTEQGTDFAAAARRMREIIRKEPQSAFVDLVDFADTHAVSPRLKHEALLLKPEQPSAESPEFAAGVEREMLELLARIEADHADHWDDASMAARERALSLMREEHLRESAVMDPVCVGYGLSKRYASTNFHLRSVDVELRAGEITALVGQNANGKTTLLRIVAGELSSDTGSLAFPLLGATTKPRWSAVKQQIGYLPQDLHPWQGALRDNLHYEAALHGLRGQENERQVEFFIERLGLKEHLDKRWTQLSGGTKLRFSLAKVLVWRPKLLVLDEPLANLDVLAQSRLLQDLLDLSRSPRYPLGVLMSSQHLHELEAVASRIIFLRGGDVVFNGPVNEVGLARSYNVYELGTSADLATLTALFDDPRCEPPSHNGLSFIIKTPTTEDGRGVLAKLRDANVEITYFRDISRSVKRLFQ